MDLSTEKQRPQLVEVVNNPSSPTKVEIENFPVSFDGPSLRVNVSNSLLNLRPAKAATFTVQLDNILLLRSDGGFFAVPLNSLFTGLSLSGIDNLLASYKSAYATLVSGVTAASLHYSKINYQNVVTSEVYNLKD